MHEVGLAQSIVSAVLLEIEKSNATSVKEINLEVGELMQLDIDALKYALKVLTAGERLGRVRVTIQVIEACFSCRRCSSSWDMYEVRKQLEAVPDHLLVREPDSREMPLHFFPYLYSSFANCPKCGSADVVTVQGDDIRLKNLVMV